MASNTYVIDEDALHIRAHFRASTDAHDAKVLGLVAEALGDLVHGRVGRRSQKNSGEVIAREIPTPAIEDLKHDRDDH